MKHQEIPGQMQAGSPRWYGLASTAQIYCQHHPQSAPKWWYEGDGGNQLYILHAESRISTEDLFPLQCGALHQKAFSKHWSCLSAWPDGGHETEPSQMSNTVCQSHAALGMQGFEVHCASPCKR